MTAACLVLPMSSHAAPVMSGDFSAQLLGLINGFQVSQAISVAATLGIPDLLRDGPKSCDALAAATRSQSRLLYRLLRALAAIGIVHELPGRQFALAPLGEPLRTDASSSTNAWACMIGRPHYYQAWCDLIGTVRTGEIAFNRMHGVSIWDFRAQRPEEAAIFDHAMATVSDQVAEAVLSDFDFSRFRTIVDVGGGEGAFLARILAAHPGMRGILFDQEQAIARAPEALHSAGFSDRCCAVAGDFFHSVPEGGDAYLLKWVLHDWDDADAVAILRCCRRALGPEGSVVVVEHVVAPSNEGAEGKFMDLNMMVITGGIERTAEEFAALFVESGFRLARIVPTRASFSVLEAKPIVRQTAISAVSTSRVS